MDWSLGQCVGDPTFTDHTEINQKILCKGCPIKDDCLQYALDNPGVTAGNTYGGMTTKERRKFMEMLSAV